MRPSVRALLLALPLCLGAAGAPALAPAAAGVPAGPDAALDSAPAGKAGGAPGAGETATASAAGTVDQSSNRTVAGTLETTHVAVEYREGYAAEADRIAAVADDYYELLSQLFGVRPGDERVRFLVGPREASPCDTAGCVDPLGRVHVSTADRSLVYHELVHTLQLRTHWSPVERLSGPAPLEGTVIEGTAAYLDTPPSGLAARARFDPDAVELTPYPTSGREYAERALFVEYVLFEYGREAFDALYTGGDVAALENATGTDRATLRAGFEDGLDEQRERLTSGGTALPAFTYEPFVAAPGEEVAFDARTPDAVAALGREWYPEEPSAFAWDLTGDGTVDVTGPTATHAFDGPGPHEVTLEVAVDGEVREATQRVLLSAPIEIVEADLPAPPAGEPPVASVTVTNRGDRAATRTVTYAVDGDLAAERAVTLAPGATTTLELRPDRDLAPGTYAVTIAVGTETVERSVSVTAADGADRDGAGADRGEDDAGRAAEDDVARSEEDDGPSAESIPGFVAAGALCALALAVLGMRSSGRHRDT